MILEFTPAPPPPLLQKRQLKISLLLQWVSGWLDPSPSPPQDSPTRTQEMALLKHKLEADFLLINTWWLPGAYMSQSLSLVLPTSLVSSLRLPLHHFQLSKAHPQDLLFIIPWILKCSMHLQIFVLALSFAENSPLYILKFYLSLNMKLNHQFLWNFPQLF